jgi:hypothetical protein
MNKNRGMEKDGRKMLNFTGKTIEGERINFGFNDIRHIVKEDDLVILDNPREVLVKFSTVKVDKYEKDIGDSNYPPDALASRLGFH